MIRRQLGAKGPAVSAIGLGCMSLGGVFGATTEAESHACLDAALAAGIDFLDTANLYGAGRSEEVIGTWLKSRKPQVTIATKAAIVPGPPRVIRNDESHLRAELHASLRRLGRERVELFYVHRRQGDLPVEELAETMARLIAEGKIGGWGLSEIAPATLRRAHAVCPVTAVQSEYSLWSRQPELGLIRACAELGVAFVPFSPLGRGMLTDAPPDPAGFGPADFRRTNPRFLPPNFAANLAIIGGFRTFARARGWTTAAAALAWVLDRGDHLIPIPGTRTSAHLADWQGAETIRLTDEDRAEIDRLLPPGFAHGDRYADSQTMAIERYC